jgi:6-phosphogluconolactonase (cycloisomerase 2 family)
MTGALSEVAGSPYATGQTPTEIKVASGKFVLVSNRTDNTISVFAINPANGQLAQVAGSPFAAGPPSGYSYGPGASFAVTPSGQFVYRLVHQLQSPTSSVYAFLLNSSTGALSEITGSPFSTGDTGITVHPSGKFLYVGNNREAYGEKSAVTTLRIDPDTGALSEIASTLLDHNVDALAIDPTGTFGYLYGFNLGVAGYGLRGFRIDGASGALSPIGGSPFDLKGSGFYAVHFDEVNKYLYVMWPAHKGAGFVVCDAYEMDANSGELSDRGPCTVPWDRVIAPEGKFAYAANRDASNISAFSVDGNSGALHEIAGSPYPAGNTPAFVVMVPAP